MLLALSFPVEAQQQAKVPKLGWLGARPAASATGLERLRTELRALGYVEGKNIAIEARYAEGKLDRLPALADEPVRLKVDVLLAAATSGALAAKNATGTIPIIFFGSGDPVALGLVDSLARPGGNITGFTSMGEVLSGKRLELLKEIVPRLSRVAVLGSSTQAGNAQSFREVELAAGAFGVKLQYLDILGPKDIETAFRAASKDRADAVLLLPSGFVSQRKQFVDLAIKNRLPAIYFRPEFVENGGLMSYSPDLGEPYRRAAVLVDKILKGAKPADLPVEQPTKFELVINLKTAKQIGLAIPPNVLARADRVIK